MLITLTFILSIVATTGYIWLQATPMLTVPHCSQLQATCSNQLACSWWFFSVADSFSV
jgi:hypothetical protein